MLENILWFFAGALAYRALSHALGFSASKKMAEFVYDYLILVLDSLDKDLKRAIEEKHSALWSAGLEEEEISQIKDTDKNIMVKWRAKVLAKFIVSGPELNFKTRNYLQSLDYNVRLKKLKEHLDKVEG